MTGGVYEPDRAQGQPNVQQNPSRSWLSRKCPQEDAGRREKARAGHAWSQGLVESGWRPGRRSLCPSPRTDPTVKKTSTWFSRSGKTGAPGGRETLKGGEMIPGAWVQLRDAESCDWP